MNPIFSAISSHDLKSAKTLLRSKPEYRDCRNELEETPLHRAVAEQQPDMVSLLLESGAAANLPELNSGNAPLHYAGQPRCPTQIAELLLQYGADLESRNRAGETPLMVAAMNNPAVAKLLIKEGAYVDLNSAIYLNDIAKARSLLESDPKTEHVPRPSWLLDTAIVQGSKEMVKLLLEHGVDPNKGRPPLFSAVEAALNGSSEAFDLVQLLLAHGARTSERSDGMSITDFARHFDNEHLPALLALLQT